MSMSLHKVIILPRIVLLALCILHLAVVAVWSAMPGRIWTRVRESDYEVSVYGCAMDAASNVYITGDTQGPFDGQTNAPPGTFQDAYLIKWDAHGTWQWTRVWGSTNANDGVYSDMATYGRDHVFVTGYTDGEFDGETNAGNADAFLTKWNVDGTKAWTRIWGSPQYDEGYGIAVSEDSASVFVCGYTEGAFDGEILPGDAGMFLTRFDLDGNRTWTRIWGPTNRAWAACVALIDSASPDVYVAGETAAEIDGQPYIGGSADACLSRFAADGTRQWTRIWGSTNDHDDSFAVATHGKGLIYVTGLAGDAFDGVPWPGGGSSGFLTAFDEAGTQGWSRHFGPTNSAYGYGVAVTPGGHIYVSGLTYGPFGRWTNSPCGAQDVFLTQWDSKGSCQWTRIWGDSDQQWYGRCAMHGEDRVAVAYSTSGAGFDGQSISNLSLHRPGVSVYDVDYYPDALNVEPEDGNIKFSWAGSWDCLYDIQVCMALTSTWLTVPEATNLPGAEVFCATTFPDVVTLFCRALAYPKIVWRDPEGMAFIPAGDFTMGQAGIAEPVHTNYIGAFWMDQTEITQAQYDEVCTWAATNGYVIENAGTGKHTNHPVQVVNWYCCVKWANARSEREGLTPCYYTDTGFITVYRTGAVDIVNTWVNWNANGYRLPTEAEWEKAARGGATGFLFPWAGDSISHSQANYYSTNLYAYDVSPTRGYHPTYAVGGFPYTAPVGSFATNAFGLYDMAGNVSEWCWDWYDANYYTNTPVADPKGPETGTWRVRRGGFWYIDSQAERCRVAYRDYFFGGPGNGDDTLGFRCVRRE